jgi:DNA-binding transcriptional MerR regulator
MSVLQVAEQAEVSVDTVRFYERRGVLPAARRRPSGFREYDASTVERIRIARALQQLGFTLDEVIDALRAHDVGEAAVEDQLWRLDAVIERVDGKIADLQRTRASIVDTVAECRAGRCHVTAGYRCWVLPARGAHMMTATPTRAARALVMRSTGSRAHRTRGPIGAA